MGREGPDFEIVSEIRPTLQIGFAAAAPRQVHHRRNIEQESFRNKMFSGWSASLRGAVDRNLPLT
jgi:hypothetical protein